MITLIIFRIFEEAVVCQVDKIEFADLVIQPRRTAILKNNNESKVLGKAIRIGEARIHDLLGPRLRGTVEEALNSMPSSGLRDLAADVYLRSGCLL